MTRCCVAIMGLLGLLAGVALFPLEAQDKAGGVEILRRLKGHTDTVFAVAYSPDGKFLATASFDNTLKLWDAATGVEIKTFKSSGHTKQVLSVAFSQDGSMLASGSADNTVKVWDVPINAPIRSFKTADELASAALSPDGTKLALGGKDGTLRLVTPAEFKEIVKFEAGHQGAINRLAFNVNGQLLASAGADRTLRFWNVLTGQLVATVGAHTGAVNHVAVNPNNAAAYTVGDDGYLKIWGLPPPVASKTVAGHVGTIRALALSADAGQCFTGSDDKTVRQFAVAQGKEVRVFSGATGAIASVATHPAGAFLAAGTEDSKVLLWNVADGKAIAGWRAHAGPVHALQVQPQAQQLMSAGGDGLVKFWSLPVVPPRVLTHPDAVLAIVTSSDGKKLCTGGQDKIVRLWDASKLAVEKQFAGHTGPVTAVALSPNLQVLASGSIDSTIRLWNQATTKETDVLAAHTAPVTALAINPAGNQMLSASEDGTVKLWQLPLVAPKPFAHPDAVNCLAVSVDGNKLVTGGNDKVVRLWNLASGAKERDYPGAAVPIASVARSGNGAAIAACADKAVIVWNAADAKVLHNLPMPSTALAIAFAGDGQSLFVGLSDRNIKQIKVADGKEIKTLAQHQGAVTGLVVSPKGDVLYSAGADGKIQTWTLPDGTPKAKFDHGPAGPASMVLALSKDGTRLAAGAGKVVKVWNTQDGKETAALTLAADVKSIGLSPDNARLIVAGTDKTARIFEMNGTLLEMLPSEGVVNAAAFIDAKRVVTAGADKLARLWTSGLVWQRGHQGPVRQAFFTSKGDQVLSGGDDKTIKLWNVADGKLMKTLTSDGPIKQLATNADATRIVSAGIDTTVKLWTLADDKASAIVFEPLGGKGMTSAIQSLSLSPNGQRVAVAFKDGATQVVRVRDLAFGKDIQEFTDHSAPVTALRFLADGRTLASASLDKTARLLDVGVTSALAAHAAGPLFAQYHPGGTQLVSAGADRTIKMWDLQKNAVTRLLGPLADPIKAIALSKDGGRVAVASGKTVKVWGLADGKEGVSLVHPADVLSLSFSTDSTRIATGSADKQTRLWDAVSGKELQFFPQDDVVAAVVLTPANNLVISGAGKATRLDTASIQRVIAADAGAVHGLALVPNNTHVLTAGADKFVKLWNLGNGAMERAYPGAAGPLQAVAISKNGLLVAAGGSDPLARVYQFADGKEIGSVKVAGAVRALAFTPNNLTLTAATSAKTLEAWSVPFTPGQPLSPDFLQPAQHFDTPGIVADITIAADSASVFGAGADKALHVWKLASIAPTRNFGHGNIVDAVAFQPGTAMLASGGHEGKVRFFDLVKNAQVKEINAHISAKPNPNTPEPIYSITFKPDGKQLLTSSYDGSLKLWDVAGATMVREFKPYKVKEFEKGHQEPIYTAAFSPDGQFVASGSSGLERGIKIWKTADATVVRDLANPLYKPVPMSPPAAHPGSVTNLRFTRDGKYLFSVGDAPANNGYLAVWDWQSGKLLTSETLPLGVFYGLAIAPDQKTIAVSAGNRERKYASPDFNAVYLLKLPPLPK